MATDRIRRFLHHGMEQGFTPLALALARRGVTADQVTIVGTLLQSISAIFVGAGWLFLGGALYLLSGALDTLDGTLARVTETASARGAFLDSTLDRIAEGAMFTGLAYYFAANGSPFDAAMAVLTFMAAMLVSYIRARAEALGIPGSDGLATRGERVLVIGIGLVFGWIALAIYFVGIAAAYTVGQRFLVVNNALSTNERISPRKVKPRSLKG